ncbi:MAG: anaerobic sulfatase maturase [Oscillospiraceae bacterium]|nr:anaerobic sulfatase maturase [Oscillospiraceae bacterium]
MSMETPATTTPYMVMAKPVGSRCNMQCTYCYYTEERSPVKSDNRRVMSDETLEAFIRQYVESSDESVVYFVWHGGEPTLAGLNFFERVIALQEQYQSDGQICRNNLQTNGLLLDDRWCSFLSKHDFDVGLSIDGTQLLHDKYRIDRGGNGTYERVAESIRLLRSHGIKSDLLCTVNADTVRTPLDVYRGLRSFGTEWMQFIPIVRHENGVVTKDSVTAEGYGSFLCAIFDEWLLNDLGKVNVQLFSETARVWAGGSAALCWMAAECGRVLIVEKDGGVYSCDHFVDSIHYLGDISDTQLDKLVDLPFQKSFGNKKSSALTDECRACSWLSVCNGGCPKDRFVTNTDGNHGTNYLCQGLKQFFSYAHPAVSMVTTLSRNRQSPTAIMAYLRNQLKEIWKDIGRNDPCPCGSNKKAKQCCWDKWRIYSN